MAWDKTKPANNEKLKDTPAEIRANWDALELGTDSALLITNDKVSPTAGIVDTKLAQITTASKVSVTAITGTLPIANGGTGLTSAGGTANKVVRTTDGATLSVGAVDVASAMVTGTLPIGNGGTGLTSAGGSANRVVLTTDGSTLAMGQVGLTNMVTGTLPTGNGGTGATGTVNSANGVVVLDGSTKLPAVDGSALTGLSAGGYTGMQVFTSSGTWTKPTGITKVRVIAIGGGGGGCGYFSEIGGTGNTSSFAGTSVTVSATGGVGGDASNGGVGGSGSGGALNFVGISGMMPSVNVGGNTLNVLWNLNANRGVAGGYVQFTYGYGGSSSKGSGGGGGYSEDVIAVSGNVSVTVGTGGTAGGSNSSAGTDGVVIVYW